jgi:hypothetical protein
MRLNEFIKEEEQLDEVWPALVAGARAAAPLIAKYGKKAYDMYKKTGKKPVAKSKWDKNSLADAKARIKGGSVHWVL